MQLLEKAHEWLRQFLDQLPVVTEWILAPLAVIGGLLMLLYGLRIFKALVIIQTGLSIGALGWTIVAELIGRPDYGWLGLLLGGVIGALLAWPLLNFFIALWGAVMGAAAGGLIADAMGNQQHIIVGLIVGGLAGGLLMLLVFRLVIIALTSLFGSALAVSGLIAMVIQIPQAGGRIEQALQSSPLVLAVVVAIPTAIGIAYQLRYTEKRDSQAENKADAAGGKKGD